MDIDKLIERQEVLVENQKQLLSAMVSTLDLMKAEKLRQENVRALRDHELSFIEYKHEEKTKQKSRPTQPPLKRPKKTMSKI